MACHVRLQPIAATRHWRNGTYLIVNACNPDGAAIFQHQGKLWHLALKNHLRIQSALPVDLVKSLQQLRPSSAPCFLSIYRMSTSVLWRLNPLSTGRSYLILFPVSSNEFGRNTWRPSPTWWSWLRPLPQQLHWLRLSQLSCDGLPWHSTEHERKCYRVCPLMGEVKQNSWRINKIAGCPTNWNWFLWYLPSHLRSKFQCEYEHLSLDGLSEKDDCFWLSRNVL